MLNRYNPALDFRNFMIPALIVMLLIIICGFLPTLNLMSEVESGTIEAINVTPVTRFTFILSKLLPLRLVALPVIGEGMLLGWLVYGPAPVGSIGAVFSGFDTFQPRHVGARSGSGQQIGNDLAKYIRDDGIRHCFFSLWAASSHP